MLGRVKSPVLFVHGIADDMIPWIHSFDLINLCKSPAKLITPEHMTHNNFDIRSDVLNNFAEFLINFCSENFTLNIDNDSDDETDTPQKYTHFPLFMYTDPCG